MTKIHMFKMYFICEIENGKGSNVFYGSGDTSIYNTIISRKYYVGLEPAFDHYLTITHQIMKL